MRWEVEMRLSPSIKLMKVAKSNPIGSQPDAKVSHRATLASQMPSSVGAITHDTFPVDQIVSPTPCALHALDNRKGKTIHIAKGIGYP
jgi:hypothetical protein